MLTGQQAFDGRTVSDILASVLAREPDLSRLPASVSPKIRSLLLRCLAKDAKERWQAIGDVRFDLEHAGPEPAIAPPQSYRSRRLAWTVRVMVAVAFASLAIFHWREKPAPIAPEMRVEITTP